MILRNNAGVHGLSRAVALHPLTALSLAVVSLAVSANSGCSPPSQGTEVGAATTIASRRADVASVQTEVVAPIGPASTSPLSPGSTGADPTTASESAPASVLPPTTASANATTSTLSTPPTNTNAARSTSTAPQKTTAPTTSTSPPDEQSLRDLLGLDEQPKWTLIRSIELSVAESDGFERPIHAYYTSQPHPENSQWLWVQRSEREFNPESACEPNFVEVFLSNRDRACLRESPGLAVRYVVDDTPLLQRGNASAGVALAAAASTTILEGYPSIDDAALPTGVVDQGTFFDIGAGDRLVSESAASNPVSFIEYAHEDGSSLIITAVDDSVESLAALRLNDLGGWDLVDDSTGVGFSGHGRRLSDAIAAWRDGDTVVQVRSTGTAGADAVESIVARRAASS